MKISVALATYNGAVYLKQQLDSLALQTVLPDELIVCDDSSTDETLRILMNFKNTAPFEVQVFKNEVNLGFNKNFERAMSLCTGDLIFLCDQDDVWFDNKLKVVSCFIKDQLNRSHLYINDAEYTDENLIKQNITTFKKTKQNSGNNHIPVNGACSVITKEFRDFLIPFPDGLGTNYDVYIHKWGQMLGARRTIDQTLQVWRMHGKNATRNEMAAPKFTSLFSLYKKYKSVEVSETYIAYRKDIEAMLLMLKNRQDFFQKLGLVRSNTEISLHLHKIIQSYNNRIILVGEKYFAQKICAIKMLITTQYKYFNGFRSFLKDILR